MPTINQNLLPDERILFRTKKHIIIFFFPALWTLVCLFVSFFMYSNSILAKVAWGPWLLALLFWLQTWLEYITAEFVVTNKRVMMREGFFNRHANELRLATISQVNIDQSLFGQLLGYGTVSLNAFGAYDGYSMIDKPFLFQRYVNEQLDQATR